jgi:CRISPR-associated exonuclease Cas4
MDVVVPISALEHDAYCPRQAAIIHVDGFWRDNSHTVRGTRGHQRVDTEGHRSERGRRVIRGLPLWSERWGLSGRADVVEITADDMIEPVEHKHGTKHGRTAEIQLCAQAFCLEEMTGLQVRSGWVWYAGSRRRESVRFDPPLRQLTADGIRRVRSMFSSRVLPTPPNDDRCPPCQVRGYCLPDLVADPAVTMRYVEMEVFGCA